MAQISGIIGSFSMFFFCMHEYTNVNEKVPFTVKTVHASGMFIYPVVRISGVHWYSTSTQRSTRYSKFAKIGFAVVSVLGPVPHTVTIYI